MRARRIREQAGEIGAAVAVEIAGQADGQVFGER
jgi:hypothetical protein